MVRDGADAVRVGKQRDALARVHAVALACHRLQVLLRHRINIADGIADDGFRAGKADAGRRRDGDHRRTAQFGTGFRIAAAVPAFQAVLQFLLRLLLLLQCLMRRGIASQRAKQFQAVFHQAQIFAARHVATIAIQALPGRDQHALARPHGQLLVGA
ncbi:hypothetical protein D3C81_1703770 [compost metagenome]